METKDHENLFKRYQSGEATLEEQAIVEDYILNNEFTPLFLSEAELEAVKVKLGQRISEIPFAERQELVLEPVDIARGKLKSKLPVWLASAAAVAAIVFGVWLFNTNYKNGSRTEFGTGSLLANDIAPGKNGATITLANGKLIQLSDKKLGVVVGEDLKYNDGAAVQGGDPDPVRSGALRSKFISGSQLTASTAKGQTYQFTLPDGTKVWLNADSKLEFPSKFVNSKTRNVKLSGEGYFEVAKDKAHPFIVATDKQEVEVLGTHFNINSYDDEGSVKTTLLEGSVKVNEVVLKPGQQSVLEAGKIAVENVDTEEAVAWKNGKFVFEYESIESVMRKLARWYNIDVVYEGSIGEKTFSGSISRSDNISKILEKITYTQNVHFKIEGRRITVMR